MTSNKKSDFLSQLSKNGLYALKQKLAKGKADPCPINTINQLQRTPLAVPAQNVSLRSLRTKPYKPRSAANSMNAAHQTESIPSTLTNAASDNNEGGLLNGLHTVTNQASNANLNESVFLVPTMRAPRANKPDTSMIDKIIEAASVAWAVLDKRDGENLFVILITYIVKFIEDSGGSESQSPGQGNDVFLDINNFLNNLGGCGDQMSDLEFPDTDTMTSISGYPPQYQSGSGHNSHAPDYRTNERLAGCDRMHQSVLGSMYEDNMYRYGINRNSTLHGGGPMLLPSFMKANSGSSVVGSMYHRNDPFINMSMQRPMNFPGGGQMLPSFMNSNSSVVGSMYQQHNNPYINQTSFMYNKPSMGYPPHPMSVRSASSFLQRCPSNHQINQAGLMKEYPSMNYNSTNIRRVPSVVGGATGLNYREDEENIYEPRVRENLEQPRKKMFTPLEPIVVLNRIESETSIIQPSQPEASCRTTRPVTSFNPQNHNESRNITRFQQNHSIRCDTTITSSTRRIGRMERPIAATPLKEVNMNRSDIIRVTRSGRVVRAPQTFWASDVTALPSHNHTAQLKGIKRKRCHLN